MLVNTANVVAMETSTPTTPAAKSAKRLAGKLATAQLKVDLIQAELEAAVVAMRAEGSTMQAIGDTVGMSRPGVLKMLRRHDA